MKKRVLITGVNGMDGSILAEQLLAQGYMVYGLIRRSATANNWRIQHLLGHPHFHILEGELTAQDTMHRVVDTAAPEMVFNLGAQSFVPYSWTAPVYTFEVTFLGVVNLLEAIRNIDKSIRFYQASSSEMYGKVLETPQLETTPFNPRSPYAVAKAAAHYATVNYRDSFGIHATAGILFNHEHEKRGREFVTRKITSGVAKFMHDLIAGEEAPKPLALGNIDAKRDWGYAEDYVKGMLKIINHHTPDAFVIATGVTRTVREFCEATIKASIESFGLEGSRFEWKGAGLEEVGYFNGKPLFTISKDFYRPAEVDLLIGDASKAQHELGWAPETSFEEMVRRMVNHDYRLIADKIYLAL